MLKGFIKIKSLSKGFTICFLLQFAELFFGLFLISTAYSASLGIQPGADVIFRSDQIDFALSAYAPFVQTSDVNGGGPFALRYNLNTKGEFYPYLGLGMSAIYLMSGQIDAGVTYRNGEVRDVLFNLGYGFYVGLVRLQVGSDLKEHVNFGAVGLAVQLPATDFSRLGNRKMLESPRLNSTPGSQ